MHPGLGISEVDVGKGFFFPAGSPGVEPLTPGLAGPHPVGIDGIGSQICETHRMIVRFHMFALHFPRVQHFGHRLIRIRISLELRCRRGKGYLRPGHCHGGISAPGDTEGGGRIAFPGDCYPIRIRGGLLPGKILFMLSRRVSGKYSVCSISKSYGCDQNQTVLRYSLHLYSSTVYSRQKNVEENNKLKNLEENFLKKYMTIKFAQLNVPLY